MSKDIIVRELKIEHVKSYNKQEEWLKTKWQDHLRGQSVSYPTNSKTKIAQLVGLSFFIGEPVDTDTLSWFVQQIVPSAGSDQQARHLRSIGWYVIGSGRGESETNHLSNGMRMPKGTYCLQSVSAPHPIFARSDRLTREGRTGARDWKDLCEYYKYKCAHCGIETRKPDKGHMNPNKAQTIDNLIPLCTSCNNWASNDVIFDENGRVKTILSKRFLEGAPAPVLARLKSWLNGA